MQESLVELHGKRGVQEFKLTEAGVHGLALLRRCVYLQHALRSVGSSPVSGTSAVRSGAGSCVSLIQPRGDYGEACLVHVASCFLTAIWTELRQVALLELRSLADVMRPLEAAAGGKDQAVADRSPLAALEHMWARCRVWIALHNAPAELLGDLNQAWTAAWAPEALSALQRAVQLLLECWRAGLAQAGEQLRAVLQRAGGQLVPEACGRWLLAWRLYLDGHHQLEAFTHIHALHLQQPQPAALGQPHARTGVHAIAASAVASGVQAVALVHPLDLLAQLASSWASQATQAVHEGVQVVASRGQQHQLHRPLLPAYSQGADQVALELNRPLALSLQLLVRQLHGTLNADDATGATTTLLAKQLGTGANSIPVVDPARTLRRPLPPHPSAGGAPAVSDAGTAGPPPARHSLPGGSAQQQQHPAQLLPPGSCPAAPSSSADSSSISGDSGAAATMGDLLEALAPLVPRRRLARLCDNPGQLALLQFLLAATRPMAPAAPGPAAADVAATATAPCASPDEVLRVARAAALAEGVCVCLHQAHTQLAARHCMSNLVGPPDQPSAFRPLQDLEVVCEEDWVPTLALTRLPLDAPHHRLGTAATAAGAASLAAAGVTADGGRAAWVHAAACRAAALVRLGRSNTGFGAKAKDESPSASAQPSGAPWLLAKQVPGEALDEEGGPVVKRLTTWARHVEVRAGELVLGAGRAEADMSTSAPKAAPVASKAGPGGAAATAAPDAPYDRPAVLHAALLAAAGRVCLLAIGTAAGGSRPRGVPLMRWAAANPEAQNSAAAAAAWSQAALLALMTVPGFQEGLVLSEDSQPRTPGSLWRLSTPDTRLAVLAAAVTSCAAAANRVAHVPKAHCPGTGADLKALCVAHSDAVTLGSAVEQLLAAAQALSRHAAWDPQTAACSKAGGAEGATGRVPGCGADAAGQGSRVGDYGGGGGGASRVEAGVSLAPALTQVEGNGDADSSCDGSGAGGGQHRRRKANWRRSLRRIMPSLGSGRGRVAASAGKERDSTAQGPPAGAVAPGDAPQPQASRGAPVKRGCWSTDPIEPMRLPAPQGARAAALEGAAAARRGPYAAGFPSADADLLLHGGRSAQGSYTDASDCAGGGSGALALSPASLALLRGAGPPQRPATAPPRPSAAEAAALRMLRQACTELRGTAARAAELLTAEMGGRIAAIFRTERTGEAAAGAGARVVRHPAGSAGRPGGAGPSATQQVVTNLLRPLREALAGLHPASQAQLLCASYASVLLVLRQAVRAAVGSPDSAAGGGSAAARRGGGAGAGQSDRARQLDDDIAVLQDEVRAGWDQVDREAATRGSIGTVGEDGGGAVAGVGGGEESGGGVAAAVGAQGFVMARSDIGIQLRMLRADLGAFTAPT